MAVLLLPRPVSANDLEVMRRLDRLLAVPLQARACCEACWLPRDARSAAARENADEADGDRGAYRRPRTTKPEQVTRSIRICCATGDHAAQPGVGDGHHLHPDGPRLRLSGSRARLVEPPASGMAAVITMEASFCVEALEDALADHGKPEIVNTDQGSQFTGSAFTGVLTKQIIAISMDGKGAWRDNVFVERLWRTIKYEEVYLRAYESISEARASIGRYLHFYNERRPHASLDGMTPDQAYFTPLPFRSAA